ncbi:MAG: hypothetical protein K0S18_462 [Anaerocolumna sp.]|jgi:predicted PurR-regulated permease PerM|nr:hypothetical protein [Anaerocolumna sp.]
MKFNDKMNKKYTIIAIYVIITAIIIYSLSLIAQNAPLILKEIMIRLGWLARVAKPIILAFVFAYLLDPIVNYFEAQFDKVRIGKENRQLKGSRTLAVFLTLIIIMAILTGIISILIFSITDQMRLAKLDDIVIIVDSFIKGINDFINSIILKLDQLNIESDMVTQYVSEIGGNIMTGLKEFGTSFLTSISNITSYVTTFLFSLIIGIYFMIDGVIIKDFINKVGKALFSEKWNNRVRLFLSDADQVFSGYIRGQLTDAAIMMMLISLTLSVIGVKFAFIIGVLAGIGNLVPYVGPFVAYISTTLICLINGQYQVLIIAIIALFIIQTVDGNIIAPKLLSHSIQIHPVLVIISLIFGSAMGGLLGMLLAVPVGALIKLLFVRFIDLRLEKKELGQILENQNKKDQVKL